MTNKIFKIGSILKFRNFIKDFEYKFLILLCGFFSAISFWYSQDFFSKKIFNDGDLLFTFSFFYSAISELDSWSFTDFSTYGKIRNYQSPVYGFYILIYYFLEKIGFNIIYLHRIFITIPHFLLGLSISFSILRVLGHNKVSGLSILLVTVFFISSIPLSWINPILTLGLAAYIYLYTLIFIILNKKISIFEIILGVISISFLSILPRFILLFIFIFIFNFFIWRCKPLLIKFFFLICLISLPIYLITIFPFIVSIFNSINHEFISENIKNSRINIFYNFFKDTTSISSTILLHINHIDFWHIDFFKKISVKIASIFFVFLIFFFLFVKNKFLDKGEKFIVYNFYFFLFLTASFGSLFYQVFYKFIPGFWILNNPMYLLKIFSIFFASLLCASISRLLLQYNFKIFKIIIYLVLIVSTLSINRYSLIYSTQHDEYYDIPNYVDFINKKLNCDFSKVLILPSASNENMYPYSKLKNNSLPNFFNFYKCFNIFYLSQKEVDDISIVNKDLEHLLNNPSIENLKKFGVKYVFWQKDAIQLVNSNRKDILNKILNDIKNSKDINLIYLDDDIEVFEIVNTDPFINIKKEFKTENLTYSSQLKKKFIYFINKDSNYSVSTLLPNRSPWDIFLDSGQKDDISISSEFSMLFKSFEKKSSNDNFSSWDFNSNQFSRLIIFNKSNIFNYPKLLIIFIVIYYVSLLVIYSKFIMNYYRKL